MYSILVTSYECNGKGTAFLEENVKSIIDQTYRPIQCIISDHSKDDNIEKMVKKLDTKGIDLIYLRYTEHYGSPCHNWNNALKHATGEYIHYLAMDDKLSDNNSVKNIVDFIQPYKWIACSHRMNPSNGIFVPCWNNNILQSNTISGPSAVVIKKELKHITLDPSFIWFLDLDWYYRLFLEAGPPVIFNQVTWVNRHHSDQLTNTVCKQPNLVESEIYKLYSKYSNPLPLS